MYVSRDINNKITGIFVNKQIHTTEFIDNNSDELKIFRKPDPTWRENRITAYRLKGWMTAYDVLDDMMVRGMSLVKSDRDEIKLAYPKDI